MGNEAHLATKLRTAHLHTLFAVRYIYNRSPIRVSESDGKKIGTEILAAAFTDQHTVVLHLAVDTPIMMMGRCRWKMNATMIREERIKEKVRHKWVIWKTDKRYYPETTL